MDKVDGVVSSVCKVKGLGSLFMGNATAFPTPDLRREATYSYANPCDPLEAAKETMIKSSFP